MSRSAGIALTVLVAGAAVGALPTPAAALAQNARAELKDTTGRTVGEATLEQQGDGVRIVATFTGLPPGTRAFHIHEVGVCHPPFESAGGHFNPSGARHGRDDPQGPHAGDLPNVEVRPGPPTRVEVKAPGVTLGSDAHGLLDADGAALVVHERADDHRSDPAGNAGGRIASGVIRP
jgi:Cu-Zn family superoxide dismutase